MVDRPIIFSAAMVRALLDGRKTQTRRLATSPLRACAAGDRLYVREAWRTGLAYEDLKPSELGGEEQVLFEADGVTERWTRGSSEPGRPRPGMHMPRWASRLTLIVDDVRIERLRSISGHDARCEGVERDGRDWQDYSGAGMPCLSAHESYATLWNSLHNTEGQRWRDNPEIVALTFRVERGNIDRLAANG